MFDREFSGQLVALRPKSLTDRDSGEVIRYFEVDLLLTEDDGKSRFTCSTTCGGRAFNGTAPEDFKGGEKVQVTLTPKLKAGQVTPKLSRIQKA